MRLGLLITIAGLILISIAAYPLYVFVEGFLTTPFVVTESQAVCNSTQAFLFNMTYTNKVSLENSSVILSLIYNNGSARNIILYKGNLNPNEAISKCIPLSYFNGVRVFKFEFIGKIAGLYYFNFTLVKRIG